jgi:hypothetical protein
VVLDFKPPPSLRDAYGNVDKSVDMMRKRLRKISLNLY